MKPTRNATCWLAAARSPPRNSTALSAATACVSGLTCANARSHAGKALDGIERAAGEEEDDVQEPVKNPTMRGWLARPRSAIDIASMPSAGDEDDRRGEQVTEQAAVNASAGEEKPDEKDQSAREKVMRVPLSSMPMLMWKRRNGVDRYALVHAEKSIHHQVERAGDHAAHEDRQHDHAGHERRVVVDARIDLLRSHLHRAEVELVAGQGLRTAGSALWTAFSMRERGDAHRRCRRRDRPAAEMPRSRSAEKRGGITTSPESAPS